MTITTSSPVAKFRGYAETCRKAAEKKRANGTQHQAPTRRRLDMLRGMEQDARRFDRLVGIFLGLADAWDDGSIPPVLAGLKAKTQVETLAHCAYADFEIKADRYQYYLDLHNTSVTEANFVGAMQALTHIALDVNHIDPVQEQIKAAKRKLFGHDIPGFFPTPDALAEQIVKLADIRAGMTVLEPSAGWGNIADAVRRLHPHNELHVCEINHSLQAVLKLKGYELFADDVLAHIPERYAHWDRIVANPPFENGQDIDHILHYFHLLRVGGRIVSIMSPSPFFASTKKAQAFRAWLDGVGGTVQELPEGSFAKGERPTGVATRLVIIDK